MYSLIKHRMYLYKNKLEKDKEWVLNKKNHRIKGPAIEWNSNEKWWVINGKIHRENDLPAIENKTYKKYFLKGQEYFLQENGTREFVDFHGRFHRLDFPAVEYSNGDQEWWNYGKRHRLDGPAVIIGNKQFWFEHGEFIKCIV